MSLKEKIQTWYNGFRFSKRGQSVYNPFSILSLFEKMDFRNYWFETGTPTFLVDLIHHKEYELPEIENLKVDELAFSSYEIERLNIVSLLVQTGYLTIKGYEPSALSPLYRLYYPNLEVENAFFKYLLASFSHFSNGQATNYLSQLVEALHKKDFERFFAVLEVFFANIPYSLQIKNEKYYHSIFYMIFKLIIGLLPGNATPLPTPIRFTSTLNHTSAPHEAIVENFLWNYRAYLHQQMWPIALILLGTMLAVVIGFPFFFQTILMRPLRTLLSGIEQVNAGELDLVLTPTFNDEVGRITEAFNRMVRS